MCANAGRGRRVGARSPRRTEITTDGFGARGHRDLPHLPRLDLSNDFAVHLWELMPDDVEEVINTLVAKRTKRPITTEELVEALRGAFPTMAAAWLAATRH